MNNIATLLVKALTGLLRVGLKKNNSTVTPPNEENTLTTTTPSIDNTPASTVAVQSKHIHGRISRDEILMGRDKTSPLSDEQSSNLDKLLVALNLVREAYGKPMTVSSGYRPPAINAQAGGAKRSCHLTCEACDFRDTKGELASWCLDNLSVLERAGLYMESPTHTKGWVHLQTRPTKNRVFIP